MKTLVFNFLHPVKGIASLMPVEPVNNKEQHIKFDSNGSNTLEVPVDVCKEGKWEIVLEWEYQGQNYCHHKEFEVG